MHSLSAIRAGLLCVLVLLLADGIIALVNTSQIINYQQDVLRSDTTLTGLQQILITLDDAETGQRGYIITKQTTYLVPYAQARRNIWSRVDHVAALMSGNAPERDQLRSLRPLISAKFAEMRQTIALRQSGKHRAALRLVRSDFGHRLMQKIRVTLSRLQARERAILNRRERAASESNQRAFVTVTIATLANAALVGLIFYVVSRWLRRRDQLLSAERTLRVEVERVAAERSAILGQIADGVLVVNAAGTVTFMNDSARQIFGRSLVGKAVSDLAAGDDADDEPGTGQFLIDALGQDPTTARRELRIVRPDGAAVVLEVSAAPVLGARGASAGAVAVFRDVTARRALEEDKSDFLSAAAHDLKTPLATIKGVTQLLRRRALRSGVQVDGLDGSLERIDVTATRMAALINELLDITRLEMGRPIDLVRTEVDLGTMLGDRVAEAQRGHPKHRLVLNVPEMPVVGTWDAPRLERVIDNILNNAIKFSPRGGTVDVTLTRERRDESEWAHLRVTDEGVGIPAEDLPHVFERFRRASNVEGVIPGTGVGLAAAAQMVARHGGTIDVSSAETAGTSVTIRLPLVAVPQAPQAPASLSTT